jgi:hypothetical protein
MRTVISRPSTTFYMETTKTLAVYDAHTVLQVPQNPATSSTWPKKEPMSTQSDHNKNQIYRGLPYYDRGHCTSTIRFSAENERHQIPFNPAGTYRMPENHRSTVDAVMGLCRKKVGAPTTSVWLLVASSTKGHHDVD